jgi:EpsI family protein
MMQPRPEIVSAAISVPQPHAAARGSWGFAAVQVALFVVTLALLWPSTSSLLLQWEDTAKATYTHGYLIVLICTWLLLRGRDASVTARPALRGAAIVLIGAGSLLWLVALRSGLQTGHQALLPVLFFLTLWSTLGGQTALRAAFAAGYFYLAIPVWDIVNGTLQSTTSLVVGQLLRITGVPAFVDGNMVHLAVGVFEIAGGCSGLHFFIVGIALAALYGEIHRDSLRMRCKLLLLGVGLSLLANWLRVYIIIVAGYLTDMQHYLVRVSHYGFGWAVFAVTMVVFFFIASRTSADDAGWPAPPAAGGRQAQPGALLLASGLSAGLSMIAMAVGPIWNALAPLQAAAMPSSSSLLPVDPGGWRGPVSDDGSDWLPVYPSADAVQRGTYSNAGQQVTVFTVVYASQAQGRELVGYGNSIAGNAGILESRDTPSGRELIVAGASGQRWLLRYFFQIGSQRIYGDLHAQLRYGVASLTGHPLSAAFAFGSPCVPDCSAASAAVEKFVLEASPRILAPSHPGDRS